MQLTTLIKFSTPFGMKCWNRREIRNDARIRVGRDQIKYQPNSHPTARASARAGASKQILPGLIFDHPVALKLREDSG
jgi:hypothetical protein